MAHLFIGVDDTDSLQGGCTTALAAHLFDLLPELQPAGPPRLVRLNPNVPWKTRGNGAIAVEMHGSLDTQEALARVSAFVAQKAERAPGTDPGVVVSDRPLPASFYDAAVSRVVQRNEVPDAPLWGGRGVIGAAAAIAWASRGARPPRWALSPRRRDDATGLQESEHRRVARQEGYDATWERIAYRDPNAPRNVDPARVRRVEETFDSIFDSYDIINDEIACVPSSPCPVLWGLRGEDPDDLLAASRIMGPHRPLRETLFLTNQGTDDHLRDGSCADAAPYLSLRVRGRVAEKPTERNGSVFVTLRDATGTLRAAAYPPTMGFRGVVAALREGDDITVCGGIHAAPDGSLTLGLEKVSVHCTDPRRVGNPRCPTCGRAMKSAGANAGYRCCGHRASAPRTEPSGLEGWHEVPSCARRHLAMPLKRALRARRAEGPALNA